MEINEYVRTKDGKIGKYIQPELGKPNITNGISFNEGANYGKHSKDIINIIEVGDYVNGYEVVDIDNGYDIETEKTYKQLWTNGNAGYGDSIIIKESEINEVLTKEQYEREVFGV